MANRTAVKKAVKKQVKKPARRGHPRTKKAKVIQLPPPVDIESAPQKPEEPKQDSGLFGLGNIFGTQSPSQNPDSSNVSSDSSTVGSKPPLTPEQERILASVPSTIGDTYEAEDSPELQQCAAPDDPIAALMAQVAFEEDDVRDILCEFFDWLSERFESDHWKLTDRQQRMLGRPAAQMANAMWVKLQQYVPDILGRWCESTPGATALLMACGIVVGPKIATQVKLSRERKNATRARNMVHEQPQPIRPAVVETPKPPTPASMIWQEASNEK